VDVVVRDKDGRFIYDLKPSDFVLTEDKTRQNIRNFEVHSSSQPPLKPVTQNPKLPPGFFLDNTPVSDDSVLNILLLDSLNTPQSDQAYLQKQLSRYLDSAPSGTRIAILGLASRLYMLQGFTSDLSVLKAAMAHKASPQTSPLLSDPISISTDTATTSTLLKNSGPNTTNTPLELQQTIDNLSAFEIDSRSLNNRFRIQLTLDAFQSLGRYLSGLPGHKNLMWFSEAFPLVVVGDAQQLSSSTGPLDNQEDFQRITNLFARAQVAVYPIDVQGLGIDSRYSADKSDTISFNSNSYSQSPRNGSALESDFENMRAHAMSPETEEHAAMSRIAEDTGGHAFFNTNDFSTALREAVDAGSNFYTITYTPTNHSKNGAYRQIHLELTGASGGTTLAYRRGYYADAPAKNAQPAASSSSAKTPVDNAQRAATAYAKTSMSYGAPQPQDILFETRILPATTSTEAELVRGNLPNPKSKLNGPFRRFLVDCVALPAQFTVTQVLNQKHSGGIEVLAYVFNADGELLNTAGEILKLNMTDLEYFAFLKHPVSVHLQVSVPANRETYLRVGVRDLPTNRIGVIEVPSVAVSNLPPPPAALPTAIAAH